MSSVWDVTSVVVPLLPGQATPGTTTLGYDRNRNLTSLLDANGYTTSYGYDADNERTGVTQPTPTGTATATPVSDSTGCDADGNVTSSTDENTHGTQFRYDALDRLITLINAQSKQTHYGYDAVGNLTSLQLPLNPATTYGYDPLNRQVSAKDPLNPATISGYDPNGNLTSVQDGLGHTTSYQYDQANEPVQTIQADTSVLFTGYDADGNIVRKVDANNHVTSYQYDVLNHPSGRTDPLGRTTSYVYDPAGNLKTLTDAMSPTRTTTYSYDAADQMGGIAYSDGVTPNVSYSYSPTGQRLTMADGTGTTSYTYDSRDRLTSQTNGAGQRVGYGYDPASNLTAIDYPTVGQTVHRTFDTLNRLTGVQDWLGHTTSFGYDDNANLHTVAFPTGNSVTATYGYDAANGLTSIVDSKLVGGTQTPFWSYQYTLDHAEQEGAVNDPVQPGSVQHNYSPRSSLDQLITDARSGTGSGSTTWGYDGAYQLTSRADSSANTNATYTNDAAGELTGLLTKTGAATTQNLTLTYNRDGDRTGRRDSVSGTSASYGYDQADRLTSYSSGATSATYAYDGDGLRLKKTVGGVASQAAWDVAEGMPTLLQEGTTRYIDGPGGTPIEQIDGSGTVRYYLGDHLGSTRGLVDASGTITDSYSYDPYGQRTAVSGSVASTPFGYAGQYTDAESGLQYLRARYYDPATGQFLTVDPLLDVTGTPYAYTADNPVNATDPSGRGICDFPPAKWLPVCSNPIISKEARQTQSEYSAFQAQLAAVGREFNSEIEAVLNTVSTPAYAPNLDGRPGDIAELRAAAEEQGIGWALQYLDATYQFLVGESITTLCNPHASHLDQFIALATLLPVGKVLKALKIGGKSAARWLRWTKGAAEAEQKDPSLVASEASVVDKLQRYLLNPDHPLGKHKARWFKGALNYDLSNLQDLARQIVFDPVTAFQTEITEHGVKYNQIINIVGANGKIIPVTFAWIRNNDGIVRLVSATDFPKE